MKADFTGLDTTRRALANKMYTPPEVKGDSEPLEGLIADGKMGLMSGSGYFDYGSMKPDELFRNRNIGLLKLKAAVETVEEERRSSRRGEWEGAIRCVSWEEFHPIGRECLVGHLH